MKFRIKAKIQESTPPVVHVATLSTVLLTIIVLYNNFGDQPLLVTSSRSSFARYSTTSKTKEGCDIFKGEWVPNREAPYYTNETCWAIHNHQNCMKHGRPDTEYLRWRWKPHGCELPIFNPAEFLELMRGKSMAFVGDSLARNQVQSLICLLSRVEYPEDVSPTKHLEFKRWQYATYDFTLAIFWSPYLVKVREENNGNPPHAGQFNLYLDEFDKEWTGKVAEFSHVIISAGHWFTRPMIYYENRRRVGCTFENPGNVTRLSTSLGHFRHLTSKVGRGTKGDTVRGRGHSRGTRLPGKVLTSTFDTTRPMLLRPDGHPSTYGHWPHEMLTLYNDCVHWCLPGPIDTWNDFLLNLVFHSLTIVLLTPILLSLSPTVQYL